MGGKVHIQQDDENGNHDHPAQGEFVGGIHGVSSSSCKTPTSSPS